MALGILAGCARATTQAPSPCPPDMAFVQGGAFLTGADAAELDLAPLGIKLGFTPLPPHFTEVGDFCMDHFEYPNRLLAIPRASITFLEAQATCQTHGKRLCTESEFARACGGLDSWHSPYGPDYLAGKCNTDVVEDVGSDRWVAAAGAFTACVSAEGIYDLEGNLSEWVDADNLPFLPIPLDQADLNAGGLNEIDVQELDPPADAVVRGGTMWTAIYGAGCHARHLHPSLGPTSNDDGFRCCMDVPPPSRPPSGEATR